jgi:hypothetical protein
MQIGDGPTTVLQIDGTVAAGNAVRFLGDAGTLELTNFSSGVLQGFSGTIAGLNFGSSPTVPTNEIDLAGIAPTGIALAELDAVTDTITVTTTDGVVVRYRLAVCARGTSHLGKFGVGQLRRQRIDVRHDVGVPCLP